MSTNINLNKELNQIYFLTFGGPTDDYHHAVNRLCKQASQFNLFDKIIGMTEKDLILDNEFWSVNENFIKKNQKGYGYWIWKPYIIKKTLSMIKENDILLYLDSGCELNIQGKNKLIKYIEMVKTKNMLGTSTCSNDYTYTKMDLIKYFNMENSIEKLKISHMQAGVLLILKNDLTMNVFNECYKVASENYNLIDDSPGVLPNFPGFKENRHDQSIFNLVVKKYNLINYDLDPTYWGLYKTNMDVYNTKGKDCPIWTCRNRSGDSIIKVEKSILIHRHKRCYGGIGDFIRASLSLYSICKRINVEYYVDFSENIFLDQAFNYKKIPDDLIIDEKKVEIIKYLQNKEKFNKEEFETKLQQDVKTYIIYTNVVGIESIENICMIREEFFKKILTPSNQVLKLMELKYKELNIKPDEYVSVHIRCGDSQIDPTNINYTSKDKRVDMQDPNLYTKFNESIIKFKENIISDNEIPILIHSDSEIFKKNLFKMNNQYKILDFTIAHISEQVGPKDSQSFIETVAEFYILSQAKTIYSPYTYSGFPHIGSLVKNIKYYTNINNNHLNLIHTNNIIQIK